MVIGNQHRSSKHWRRVRDKSDWGSCFASLLNLNCVRAWPPPALHGPSISRLIMERARFHLVGALLHFPSNETQLILPREEDRREERGGEKRIGEGKRGVKEDVGRRRRKEKKKGGEKREKRRLCKKMGGKKEKNCKHRWQPASPSRSPSFSLSHFLPLCCCA